MPVLLLISPPEACGGTVLAANSEPLGAPDDCEPMWMPLCSVDPWASVVQGTLTPVSLNLLVGQGGVDLG